MPTRRDLANAIRALSMDAVQQAKSGHPGMPMGMADIAEVLWRDYYRHNPTNPRWINRDRFLLSNGHGSMLQYALLHLTGYDVSIEDLRNFRQLHSATPGHPEYGYTPGVETTTGPLGQGLANAVGMALAEKHLAARFNCDGLDVIDHYTWAFLGDGCLMEGISHEACSLAGTWGLGKLVCFYDDNGISIDGEVQGWFTDDTVARFRAYGWQVIPNIDGHDDKAIRAAIEAAREDTDRPTLICCRTTIGFGAPNKQGTAGAHGAPLGDEEIARAREALNWPHAPFEIPEDIRAAWSARQRGANAERAWQELFDRYRGEHPELAAELTRRMRGELPENFSEKAQAYVKMVQESGEDMASRKASQKALNAFGGMLPELVGGSADLAESNLTLWNGAEGFSRENPAGNYLYFGVREFGMSAICNGIALHGGLIPYSATFLIFMEYARNAVRLCALMKQRHVFVYTHDSVGLGEDGPTHQPVEQLANLRATPNLDVWRPCDAAESAAAWKCALERADGPSALAFSRQGLPHQQRSEAQLRHIERGGYVLAGAEGVPDAIIIATGSEVGLAMQAREQLAADGIRVRVVSMPCVERFARQDDAWREQVLPDAVTARVAVEAAHPQSWYRWTGSAGAVIGIDRFGESAPGGAVLKELGIHVDAVVTAVRGVCGKR